jgi:hypothetical protein
MWKIIITALVFTYIGFILALAKSASDADDWAGR